MMNNNSELLEMLDEIRNEPDDWTEAICVKTLNCVHNGFCRFACYTAWECCIKTTGRIPDMSSSFLLLRFALNPPFEINEDDT